MDIIGKDNGLEIHDFIRSKYSIRYVVSGDIAVIEQAARAIEGRFGYVGVFVERFEERG